jgi:hypothetical protein
VRQPSFFDFVGNIAPACRREALASITPAVLRDQHKRIIECLTGLGPQTDEAIQEWTGLSPSSERPRRGELVEIGIVRDSGTTAPTHSGRSATRWEMVKP